MPRRSGGVDATASTGQAGLNARAPGRSSLFSPEVSLQAQVLFLTSCWQHQKFASKCKQTDNDNLMTGQWCNAHWSRPGAVGMVGLAVDQWGTACAYTRTDYPHTSSVCLSV